MNKAGSDLQHNAERIQTGAEHMMSYASYISHLVKDKPVMVAASALLSQALVKIAEGLPDHLVSIGALFMLCLIDWYTKMKACKAQGVPFTSRAMREKGFPKLRDYMVLYIAGACTIPLMGDQWGFKSILFMMALWELWSIAENLYDAGTLPFDVRKLAIFDSIREYLTTGKFPVPFAMGQNPVTPASLTVNIPIAGPTDAPASTPVPAAAEKPSDPNAKGPEGPMGG